jgi:L-ascorbate metabolism protein UlaG (beta-lactamase superfamily)
MEIVWYGHSCFRLKTRGAIVLCDPCGKQVGYTIPRMRADIVTISADLPDYNNCSLAQGDPRVIRGPGEHEVKGVFVTGISTAQKKGKATDLPRNTLYLLDFDGLTVCHLGSLDHVLPQNQLETLSDVDVLLIPVGANTTLNANQAAEVIGQLEPKIVIPMHYKTRAVQTKLDPVSKFLKEMGIADASARDSLEIDKGGLPSETQVIVLNYKE